MLNGECGKKCSPKGWRRVAVEWDVIQRSPKVKFLAGEHRRERVITPKEEALYRAAALPLLHDVSVVLFGTGMRPEECHRLRWEEITWDGGRNGLLLIAKGKTKRRGVCFRSVLEFGLSSRIAGGPRENRERAGFGRQRRKTDTSWCTIRTSSHGGSNLITAHRMKNGRIVSMIATSNPSRSTDPILLVVYPRKLLEKSLPPITTFQRMAKMPMSVRQPAVA